MTEWMDELLKAAEEKQRARIVPRGSALRVNDSALNLGADRVETRQERARLQYKPESTKVLFLGESPPSSGTFFYYFDSNLYKYTKDAFQEVYGYQAGAGERFLQFFQSMGCWVDDLCLQPGKPKGAQCYQAVPSLAARIREAKPLAFVGVMLGIEMHLRKAIRLADLEDLPQYFLRFPAQGNQRRYVDELAAVLRRLQKADILPGTVGGTSQTRA